MRLTRFTKLAGAVLAGAVAFGAATAQAQNAFPSASFGYPQVLNVQPFYSTPNSAVFFSQEVVYNFETEESYTTQVQSGAHQFTVPCPFNQPIGCFLYDYATSRFEEIFFFNRQDI